MFTPGNSGTGVHINLVEREPVVQGYIKHWR